MRLPGDDMKLLRLAIAIVAALTLARVLVLIYTPLELYPDEAQYWWWSQSPDWGYFSKPPLIAWIIRATTVFGDQEWAIRLASPLLHGCTALVLFGIGRTAFDARVGFWSAIAYATLPGVSYSSELISTDVPLLLCWAVALYAFLRALADVHWRWPLTCGLALGFGLLAKYAMAYFVVSALVSALVVPEARRLVFSSRGLLILALGLLMLLPNLVWNAAHGFPTLVHTEANANWGHARFAAGNALSFAAGQFGVFGPLMMIGFLIAVRQRLQARESRALVLLAFSLPVLLLILLQSFIAEANANWAAPAYIAAVPLAVPVLARWWRGIPLRISLALGAVAMVGLWIVAFSPRAADAVGQGNAFKRQQGWRQLGQAVVAEARHGQFEAIAATNRSLLAELLYYARPRSIPIRAWSRACVAHDHFQMTIPLTGSIHHVLLAIGPTEEHAIVPAFESRALIRTLTIPVGAHRTRIVSLYVVRNYRAPQSC